MEKIEEYKKRIHFDFWTKFLERIKPETNNIFGDNAAISSHYIKKYSFAKLDDLNIPGLNLTCSLGQKVFVEIEFRDSEHRDILLDFFLLFKDKVEAIIDQSNLNFPYELKWNFKNKIKIHLQHKLLSFDYDRDDNWDEIMKFFDEASQVIYAAFRYPISVLATVNDDKQSIIKYIENNKKMKARQYDWVPFFSELSKKISALYDDDNRDEILYRWAEKIFEAGDSILKFKETINPFTFVYALAQRNTSNQKDGYYTRVKQELGIDSDIPTDWVFPTPTALTKVLYSDDSKVDIWSLFNQVCNNNEVSGELFNSILSLKNVGAAKLTQTLFLINPQTFFPYDEKGLGGLPLTKIREFDFSTYKAYLENAQALFPGCLFYEVNYFLYLITSTNGDKLMISDETCQISTNIEGKGKDKKNAYSDFVKQNAVWTGSAASTNGDKIYPLTQFNRGDIVLVRQGTKQLGGVGVILDNEYIPDGYSAERQIRIIWINKEERKSKSAIAQWEGVDLASEKTIEIFRDVYADTFKLLEEIGAMKPEIQAVNKEIMNNKEVMHPLNQILYGPPGTGKTYELSSRYFADYTSTKASVSKEEFIKSKIEDKAWWEVIALVILELGTCKVIDIYEHKLLQLKSSLSNSNNVRPTIWGQLQIHTVDSCENVNYSKKGSPLIFNKTDDKKWQIVEEELKEQCPDLLDLHAQITNFSPGSDIEIKRYEFVTFHQSFAYEDFIEGIKPDLSNDNGELNYIIEDGVFKKMCAKARNDSDNNYAIFIDEINRGNVSQIFGELITLIEEDKRAGQLNELSVTLPYSKEVFNVPINLHIIGTMNTADRSVEALDTALRRRFQFVEMAPDPNVIEKVNKARKVAGIDLVELLETINKRIEVLLDRDHMIGHSYFLKMAKLEDLKMSFSQQIIPLLQEYFYGDYGKIALVLGEGFCTMKEQQNVSTLFAKVQDYDADSYSEKRIFELKNPILMDDVEFKKAIRLLLNTPVDSEG